VVKFSPRSATHFTGRPTARAANITMTFSG
jgi:hypothetical protein